MDGEIHSVDTEKRDSEGNILYVRGARINLTLKQFEGLQFGEYKDQHYIELQTSCWECATKSTLTARFSSDELQQLFEFALEAKMIDSGVNYRILELLEHLHEELEVWSRQRQKIK